MRIVNTVAVLIVSFLMIACSGGGGDSLSSGSSVNPSIGAVYTDILHAHPSFFTKWNAVPVRKVRFTVAVAVTDPQGLDNLWNVSVYQAQDDRYWSLLEQPRGNDCYRVYSQQFECIFYDYRPDSLLMKEWEIRVEDKDGNTASKRFEFSLPGGAELETERFVYAPGYAGSTTNGVEALEAMTIVDNGIAFTSNPGTQSFRIEFEPDDVRARFYSFAFYDSSVSRNYIGAAESNSPSIVSRPIIPGLGVVIDLPWSEIGFYDGFDGNDVGGLHIKLLDEPVDWQTPSVTGSWFNYVSFSEYIEL